MYAWQFVLTNPKLAGTICEGSLERCHFQNIWEELKEQELLLSPVLHCVQAAVESRPLFKVRWDRLDEWALFCWFGFRECGSDFFSHSCYLAKFREWYLKSQILRVSLITNVSELMKTNELHAMSDGLVQVCVSPQAPYSVSEHSVSLCFDLRRGYKYPFGLFGHNEIETD